MKIIQINSVYKSGSSGKIVYDIHHTLLSNILSCCSLKNKKIVNLFSILFSVFLIIYFFYKAYFGDDILNIFPYMPFWR